MSLERIIEQILSDAKTEAKNIVLEAEINAEKIISTAQDEASENRKKVEEEVCKKVAFIKEHKEANARLESQKIELKAKRDVLDGIYARALERMISFSEEDSIKLIDNLLKKYAEEGDVVHFATNFKYKKAVERLPVYIEKKLVSSDKDVDINGGLWLEGKISDKDLSYESVLAFDREEHQSDTAKILFSK